MIILDEEKGVNPRLTFCQRCGGETNDLMLVGNQNKVYSCGQCRLIHYGSVLNIKCPRCDARNWILDHELDDNERLPASEPCDKCKEMDNEVANGGIYWKCKDCGSNGAIKAGSQMSIDVRDQMNIKAPDKCGVEFSKDKHCPVCCTLFKRKELA